MRKTIKTMCMAAETKQEYKTETAPIRAELKELDQKAKALREENKTVAAEYKAVRLAKKNGGTVTISKEIKALKTDSKQPKGTIKALGTETKNAAKSKDFNTAMDNLKKVVDIKEERVEKLEKNQFSLGADR